ncbi:hypothetical protein NMG60_11032802 [Bertholletia excelsa]
MEYSSSSRTKGKWKWKGCVCPLHLVSGLAGFMGCFVLMLCLNYNPNTIRILSFRNISITFTSSPAAAKTALLWASSSQPTHEMKSTNKTHASFCNIFQGRWLHKPGEKPLYEDVRCPFLSERVRCRSNGRPDLDYRSWSWEAEGCQIPRFNGKDMLERLRGKRLVMVGDSLNRNQWESLACLLYSVVSPSRAHVDVESGVYKVFKAKDYNCSVEFHWSPFLVQLDTNPANGTSVLRLEKVVSSAKQWLGADIMVFNTGHWWVHNRNFRAWHLFDYKGRLVEDLELELAFETAMKTWARWIDQNVDSTKTAVFFRSVSPEHRGKQWCYNQTKPIMDESFKGSFPEPLMEALKRTIRRMKTPVRYMNVTKLSEYRIDAHPAWYGEKRGKLLMENKEIKQLSASTDCSHWCLPGLPDTWNRLLYTLLVFDTLGKRTDSSRILE